jgi:hypothetical protein
VIGFVNRYVGLAGRNCCSGKSWAALDRTLDRYACECDPEPPANTDERSAFDVSAERDEHEATPAAEHASA